MQVPRIRESDRANLSNPRFAIWTILLASVLVWALAIWKLKDLWAAI